MAETHFGQGCTQFSGAGQILQTIHQEFQFKGQTPNRINQRQRDLAVGRAVGDSLQDPQEKSGHSPGVAYAKF